MHWWPSGVVDAADDAPSSSSSIHDVARHPAWQRPGHPSTTAPHCLPTPSALIEDLIYELLGLRAQASSGLDRKGQKIMAQSGFSSASSSFMGWLAPAGEAFSARS